MGMSTNYDYRQLSVDTYRESSRLLRALVAIREMRGMTQAELADEMNVSQGYVSQIENGHSSLTTRLEDYAIEVGARIRYIVEPAERMESRSEFQMSTGGGLGSPSIAVIATGWGTPGSSPSVNLTTCVGAE